MASGVLIDDLPIDPWGELGEILGGGAVEPVQLPSTTINTWYLDLSQGIGIGRESTAWPWTSKSYVFSYSSGVPKTLGKGTTNWSPYLSISANLGSYIDISTSVSLAYTVGQYLNITAENSSIRFFNYDTSCFIVPDEVQLLIDGEPAKNSKGEYLRTYPVSIDGSFSIPAFSGISYQINDFIHKIGFRFLFTEDHVGKISLATDQKEYGFGVIFTDNSVVEVADNPFNPPDPDPDPSPSVGPDNPGGDTEEDEQKGLLRSILDAIANIGQTILNGIKGLFVPDQEDITEIKDKYQTLLEERLGFVYEGYTMLSDGFTTLRNSMGDGEEYTFHFPGVQLPYQGETLTIIEEQDVDLDNGVFQVLRPVLGTIVSLIAVVGVVKVCFRVVSAIISGVSFFQFQSSSDGGDED